MKLKLIVGLAFIIFAENAASDDDQARKRAAHEFLARAAKRHETIIATGSLDVFEDTLQDEPQPIGLSVCSSSSSSAADDEGQSRKRLMRCDDEQLEPAAKRQETVGTRDVQVTLHNTLQDDAQPVGLSACSSSSSSLLAKPPVTMSKVIETLASRRVLKVPVDTLSIMLLDSVGIGEIDLVKFLLSQGADIEAKNCIGATPLIWACFRNHLKIVKHLVEVGADTEARDDLGRRPLMLASLKGYTKIVKHLVEARGVQIYPVDMQIAAEFQKNDLLAYLMHKSGKYNNTLECAICFEPNAVYTSSCCFSREYCKDCVDKLVKNETSCPMCRTADIKTKLINIQDTMVLYVQDPAAEAASSSVEPSCSSSSH